MKKPFLFIFTLFSLLAYGQAEETFKGEIIPNKTLLLKFDRTADIFEYKVNPKESYVPLDSAQLFRPKSKKTKILLTPLNPILYSVESNVSFEVDQEFEDLQNAIKNLISFFGPLTGTEIPQGFVAQNKGFLKANTLSEKLNIIRKLRSPDLSFFIFEAENRAKAKDKAWFDDLKEEFLEELVQLDNYYHEDFVKYATAKAEELIKIEYAVDEDMGISSLEKDFDKLSVNNKNLIASLALEIPDMLDKEIYIKNGILSFLEDAKKQFATKAKGIESLKALSVVLKEWKTKIEEGKYVVNTISLKKGKISVLDVSITKRTVSLSDDKTELIVTTKKKLTQKLKFKKYNRIVFEVTPGVAFVDLSFANFTTTTNENEEMELTEGPGETFDQINFQLMLNMNIDIPNVSVKPFIQIGAGPSNKYPIFFTGGGLRITDALRISLGGAWTWINELNELSVGDMVSGQAAIDEDVEFVFSSKPRFYLGVQIKL